LKRVNPKSLQTDPVQTFYHTAVFDGRRGKEALGKKKGEGFIMNHFQSLNEKEGNTSFLCLTTVN